MRGLALGHADGAYPSATRTAARRVGLPRPTLGIDGPAGEEREVAFRRFLKVARGGRPATGASTHVLNARQLTGEAGAMQLPGAELAVVNMGGHAVATYATTMELMR